MSKCKCGSGEEPYWVNDGNGIPLAKVCDDCRSRVLARFRPEILQTYTQEDVDEPIGDLGE